MSDFGDRPLRIGDPATFPIEGRWRTPEPLTAEEIDRIRKFNDDSWADGKYLSWSPPEEHVRRLLATLDAARAETGHAHPCEQCGTTVDYWTRRALSAEEWTRIAARATPAVDVELAWMTLTERRAWFVYEAARLAAVAALAPIIPEPWAARERPFRDQFLAVIERETGSDRKADPADLHADWVRAYKAMGWRYGAERDPAAKTHPDMVPYDDLDQLERDKDAVFVALCDIARQWVYARKPEDEG